jgi:hypothetical protein
LKVGLCRYSKNGRWIQNGLHVVVPKTKLYDGSEEGEAFLKLRACIWRRLVHFLTFYGLGAVIYMLGVANDIKLQGVFFSFTKILLEKR